MSGKRATAWTQNAYEAELVLVRMGDRLLALLWKWRHLALDSRVVLREIEEHNLSRQNATMRLYNLESGAFRVLSSPEGRDPERPLPAALLNTSTECSLST
ncbi:MAG: hypothetical protein ACYTGL_14000 [Planctomycetota bacterium]|jgi:hypothetical protein